MVNLIVSEDFTFIINFKDSRFKEGNVFEVNLQILKNV